MEKQKNKAKKMPNRRKSLSKFFLIGSGIFALIIIVLIILGPTDLISGDGQIRQTSLPDELRPTAEYILDTVPLDERIPLIDGVSIQIDTTGFGANTICLNAGRIRLGTNYPQHSQIFVNGRRVRDVINLILLDGFTGSERMNLCVSGNLESGLHLIEFHLRDSFWGDPIAIQQWAIEIE